MKRTLGIILAATIAIALFFALRHSLPAPPPAAPDATSSLEHTQTNGGLSAASTSTQTPSTPSANQAATTPAPTPPTVVTQTPEQRAQTLRQALEQKNVPIDFYGRVIDQNSNSVSGVKVKIYVRHWELVDNAMSQPIRTEKTSDADGRFDIHGPTGDAIDIEAMEKEGYELSPKFAHSSGPTGGSPESPVIYQMWKTGEKTQLVGGNKLWGVVPDGRTYTIDLLQGTKDESATAPGDLRIAVNRPPNVSRKDRFDWSFKIMPIEGGILETADEFMYQAPDSGYVPEYDFHLNSSDTNWTYRVKKDFYVKARGHYARINVEVFARYQNGGVFSIGYAVNPTGSRNLQP